jgi:hypothetical protein
MTCLLFTLPPIGGVPTLLTLPQSLTSQGLLEVEQSVAGTLSILKCDLLSAGLEPTSAHALPQPDAAEIEYASWMPDRGTIEFDSWAVHLHASLGSVRNDSRTGRK